MFKDWKRADKGFFNGFEKEMEQINDIMTNMMRSVGTEPQVYGFSMQVGPDGVPHIERFGNIVPVGKDSDVREPFTSSMIDEKNNEFNITAEMPGINKEEIELNATENEVVIKANSATRKYYKFIPAASPIDPESANAKYNNGVLEVTFKLKDSNQPKGKSIKIE
ncbi:MAG: Hsp20/alpha crystallin family protein [Candidatus Methanoperedens sp.]|nr:Hsp20/alpha crystallin family protein [Candidatus Methanoperedens sp.]